MIYPFTVPQAKKLNNSQAFSLVLYMYIELFWGGNAQIRQWVGTGHGYRGCVTLNGGKIEESSTVNKISHLCRLWQEPEWKRMRTPSPESGPWVQHCRIYTLPSLAVLRPGNRSYELPEADPAPLRVGVVRVRDYCWGMLGPNSTHENQGVDERVFTSMWTIWGMYRSDMFVLS